MTIEDLNIIKKLYLDKSLLSGMSKELHNDELLLDQRISRVLPYIIEFLPESKCIEILEILKTEFRKVSDRYIKEFESISIKIEK